MAHAHEESFPDTIAGFRVLRRLATGGTSDVLLAESTAPRGAERVVVLKLLLARYKNDPKFERMFAREATAYARLNHPSIVKLYDFFSTDARGGGELVMVLEYVDGVPLNRLRAWLAARAEPLDDRASVFLASCIFSALASAHAAPDPDTREIAPVIHRDINPSNVLLPWDGNVKLTDFGIAKVTGLSGDTKVGRIKGTFGYMAPEQVRGEATSTRTDVYATSLLLWELLARRRAIQHQALSELEALRAMAHPSLPSLDVLRPELPKELRALVALGLAPDPEKRDLSAADAARILSSIVRPEDGRAALAATLARLRHGGPTLDEDGILAESPFPPTVREPPLSDSDFADTDVAASPYASPAKPLPRFPSEADPIETRRARSAPPPRAAQSVRPPAVAPQAPQPPQAPRPAAVPRPQGVPGLSSRTLAFGDKLPGGGGAPSPAVPRVASPPAPPAVAAVAPVAVAPPAALAAVPFANTVPLAPPLPPVAPLAGRVPVLDESRPALTAPQAPSAIARAAMPPTDVAQVAFAPPAPEPGRPIWYQPGPASIPPPAEPRMSLAPKARAWLVVSFALAFVVVFIAGAILLFRGGRARVAQTAAVPSGVTSVMPTAPPSAAPSVAPSAAATVAPPTAPTTKPTAPPTPTAPVAPTAPPVASAPSHVAPSASSGGDTGQIHVGAIASGHRVFVDGHVVGEGPGTYHVKCGARAIRIGSSGKPRAVSVACGGVTEVR